MRPFLCLCILLPSLGVSAFAQSENLLRNGDFQDDWSTLLPELKNHHWNYSTEVYNRRDYNPDSWQLSGKWHWQDADKPRGQRRIVLSSPSRAVQSVNWVTINNSAMPAGWPDAGGFPQPEAIRSKQPELLVRDLTFRMKLSGKDVPKDAVKLAVAWGATSPIDDPTGGKRTLSALAPIPEGTYTEKVVEVKLTVPEWFALAKKEPMFAAQGALIPMAAVCELVYADKQTGTVILHEATLSAAPTKTPNLLYNGNFEMADRPKVGLVPGWSTPRKYRYFPPGLYYIFNTWHNSNSENRGATTVQSLICRSGRYALQMNLPPGDEVCVVSDPIALNQKEARLIEVSAWVKTDQLAQMQVDAEDENGKRIDGFNFIHKAMPSVGTIDWRIVRQVFRPSAPLKSIRLKLCARGANGYTLGGTGLQPQQNASGIIWWDDVQLSEPESTAAELAGRGVKTPAIASLIPGTRLAKLDLGERLLGANQLTAEIVSLAKSETYTLELEFEEGGTSRKFHSDPVAVEYGKPKPVTLTYTLSQPGSAYANPTARLTLVGADKASAGQTVIPLSTWTTPIDLELGAVYLQPGQRQFVRANLGLTHAAMTGVKQLRLEVLRRGTGEVLKTYMVPAAPEDIAKQRAKIPDGLREDFRNMLLADLDVSLLPIQPFSDPQRNWVIRATIVGGGDQLAKPVLSAPFCRLAHDGPQPAIASARISDSGEFLVNDKPWMPWGVCYGHNPVYDGPAVSGKYHDLANLKSWSLYDRHGGNLADRSLWDGNCVRHVEGALIKQAQLEELWKKGNYASTVFIPPPTAKTPWPDDYLKFLRTAPMVAAVSRGPEEAFGYFLPMTSANLDQVKSEADYLRKSTGKPVMVGHGGYWTRLELEKAPFFDVYDPETEPWYPAPVHTDLAPLVAGKAKVIWLRPQMYESVPYERWRYHVYVELMRGARGWQVAHGPGDSSTFRGLHAELRRIQPALDSKEKPPAVKIEPGMEHMVRIVGGKTTVIAATTHGMSFGNWKWDEAEKSPVGRARVTSDPHIFRDESDGYHMTGDPDAQGLTPHGIQYLPHARSWPAGTSLTTWVKLDAKNPPKNLVALVKVDGRWTHAVSWGAFDSAPLRKDNAKAFWFLRTFYRHARGFLGWGDKVSPEAMQFVPDKLTSMGELPKAGEWVKLEVPLDKLNANGKLLDGVGFLHDGGRVWWSNTLLTHVDIGATTVFGDYEDRPDPAKLEKAKFTVAGLKKGTKIRVLFEDREISAEDGYFVDSFRGVDLYQRYGGERSGYGNAPVAVHAYEFPTP